MAVGDRRNPDAFVGRWNSECFNAPQLAVIVHRRAVRIEIGEVLAAAPAADAGTTIFDVAQARVASDRLGVHRRLLPAASHELIPACSTLRQAPVLYWQAEPMLNGSPRHRIAYVDGLRAVAVLLVVAFHAAKYSGMSPAGPMASLLRAGSHGVDLFFVLSGFCLSYPRS